MLSAHSRQEWIAWKQSFINYINDKDIIPCKQGDEFYKYIGETGREILKNFYFHSSFCEKDIDILFFKFDVYFTFCGRKKHNDESVDDYAKALKVC